MDIISKPLGAPNSQGFLFADIGPNLYCLEGHGALVSRLRTPITHIVTLAILIY